MIVVKATYRNETRKFSFEYNSLPTYYDLQTQLCRVFPLLNFRNFYLSQLLFSPNASQPGHILIAREVHDLEGYSASTKPHQRYFVNALLKFNVMDKQPLMSNPQNSVTRSPFATQNIARVDSGSNSGSAANSTKADSVTSVASTHSLAESIDQMNSSIQDLRKNLDKLTLATLGRSADPCTICNSPIGGLRYTCRNCDACVCSTCNLKGDYFCIVTSGVHSLNLAVAESSTFNASEIPSIPLGSFPNLAESYHPSTTDAFSPFNSTPLASSGASMQVDDFTRPTTPTPSIRAPPPPPVIHEDYDMCSRCVIDGGLNNHDAAHEWISLDKPTRVIIHKPNNTTSSQAEDATIHNATCDLCDSVIVGQRYKCTTCPDFDTCKACFSIVNEQHPKHHFIRIDHPSAYIQQRDRPRARHPAFCDVCRKTIYGVRYKCMHTHCPDFDLCEDCEALPIPQHPPSHPFLKIRTSDVVIPMVVHGGPRQGSAIAPSGHLPRRGSVVMPTQMPLPRVKLPVRGSLDSVHLAGSNVPPESARPQTPVQEEPSVTPAFDTTSLPPADVKGDIESEFAHAEVQPFNSQRGEAEATSLPQSSSQSVKPEASQIFQPAACASPVVGSADAVSVAKESTSPVAAPAPWDLSRGLNILLQADIPSETEEEHSETNCSPDGAPATPETKEISGVKNEWPNATVLSAEAPALPPLESLPTLPSNLFAPALNGSVLSTLFSPPTPPPVIEATLPSAQSEPSGNDEAINLSASCLGNVTVPDRQVFPPGSTFVKCWKMVNDGNCDWPADTRITFVGGDSFLSEQTATFLIGQAKCGEVRNVWTGELKAPEVPGRYMSYWRLRDENGTAFGQPVWIDIEVLEPLSRNLEDNLSSSSVVVMPNLEAPVAPPDSPKSASTSPSVATEDDGALSDTSFVSVGSSSDDEDADLWTDSRHQVPSTQQETQGVDYVLLYDDNTSDEDL